MEGKDNLEKITWETRGQGVRLVEKLLVSRAWVCVSETKKPNVFGEDDESTIVR